MVRMVRMILACTLSVLGATMFAAADDGAWTHRGRDVARNSVADPGAAAPAIATPRFVASVPDVDLVGQSAPVVADHKVFVSGRRTTLDGDTEIVTDVVAAFSEIDGQLVWAEPVGIAEWDSFSPPTVDLARGNVLMASGNAVTALDMDSGAQVWQATLGTRPVVNSSICVFGDQAFVIDYTGAMPGATLYVLNLDPNHATLAAGEVAWTQPINKCGGGDEVAVDESGVPMLIVTDSDGYLRQFSPDGQTGWVLDVPGAGSFYPPPPFGAFFGGSTVVEGRVYAATYEFYGVEDSGLLYCVDATTGAEIWSEPSERTDAIPIVTDSLVILSAGLDGYGSVPKVEAFDKVTGLKQWEWTGGGGWTVQPVLVGDTLYVGALPVDDDYAPCTALYALDLTKTPDEPGFIVASYAGAGSSPAFAHGNIYTIGAAGLHAFGPAVTLAGDPAIEVATEDGLDWVYQNTPNILAKGGHYVTLTVTVTDLNGNDSVRVAVAKRPGSGVGEVVIAGGATTFERLIYGSDRSLGLDGYLTLDVTAAGNVAGSTTIGVPFRCRVLGDIDGNGGAEPTDMSSLINTLNGMKPPGIPDAAFDLDANGGAEPGDLSLLINILNGLPVR
ncbi:MAG: PQQ-binding-like beta-propeller repeat protein [Planctomycetes bacterium]|nr:PQQ-binding-like beta-propeller repeat protein [Planctomycetota bacterium]